MAEPTEYSAESIKIIEFSKDNIRKKPHFFFGKIDEDAADHLVYELVANAIDQFLAGNATCVSIKLDEPRTVRISDDGAGMPFMQLSDDKSKSCAEHYMTTLHDLATADKHAPHIHIGQSGVGLAAVNSVCETLHVKSFDGTHSYEQSFAKGHATSAAKVKECTSPSGTTIELTLDTEVFGGNFCQASAIRAKMFELVHLYPGLEIEFQRERFLSSRGLVDLAHVNFDKPDLGFTKEFSFQGLKDGVQVIACAIGGAYETHFRSWVNGMPTALGGVHVEAFKQALAKARWTPSVACIHIIMHEPRYAAPTKSEFRSDKAAQVIGSMLAHPLGNFVSQNHDPFSRGFLHDFE